MAAQKDGKPELKTRTPKKVTPSGTFDNLRKLPHPIEEIIGVGHRPATDGDVCTNTLPSPPTLSSHPSTSPVSPVRDFMKVPNSLVRESVPAGVFSGKSKQMYDYLYSLTRGAIVPKRTVRVTREQLMKGSGIGAKTTLEQNISRLKQAHLVQVRVIGGVQGGNEYTIYTPDEVATLATLPSHPSIPSQADNGENVATLESLHIREPRHGVNSDRQRTSGDEKTLFKTNQNNDDEVARQIFERLCQGEREVTGGESDPSRWIEVVDILVAELRDAAQRTVVTSAPAFLATHLRRRFSRESRTPTPKDKIKTVTEQTVGALASTIDPPTAEELAEYEQVRLSTSHTDG